MISGIKNNFKKIGKHAFILLSLCLFIIACSKEAVDLPTSELSQPIFYIKGQIGNDSLSLAADESGYYMFTEFWQNPDGTYRYRGELRNPDCADCESLAINFNVYLPTSSSTEIEAALNPDFYPYTTSSDMNAEPDDDSNTVYFMSQAIGVPPFVYRWNLGDGTLLEKEEPVLEYRYDELGTYLVHLETEDAIGCLSEVAKQVDLNIKENECQVIIETPTVVYDSIGDVTLPNGEDSSFVFAYSTGFPPFNYEWSNGSDDSFINWIPGETNYCVTITDGQGCISESCINLSSIISNPSNPYCETDFIYEKNIGSSIPIYIDGVSIEYIDKTGDYYSSEYLEQNIDAFFNLLEVEDYEKNEMGQLTKKIQLHFSCKTMNNLGNVKDLSNFTGSFGLAYSF